MRNLFTAATALLTLAVAGQFYLAGRGAVTADYEPHHGLGYLTVVISVAVLLTGILARLPRRVVAMAALAVGLLVLQPVLARTGKEMDDLAAGGLVLGLHALNGAVVLAVLGTVLRASRMAVVVGSRTPATTGS
jgi:hypothetical protein